MKIAFVQFLYYEYLGVMYLSSSLKEKGHAVDVFICPERGDLSGFADEIIQYGPGIVAFSVMTGSERTALALARMLKERSAVYVVFGGPHPTAVPEIVVSEGVDCICRGEAEGALAAIAGVLAAGGVPENIPGSWCKVRGRIVRNEVAPLQQDLDGLPRPDRALYRAKYPALRGSRAGFITGRGCPYQCTFCSNPALMELYRGKGSFVRRRTVTDVIDEIRDVVRAYGIRTVYFEDDTFILDRDWVLEFCEAYRREVGVAFSCHIRADLATEELIAALSRANCGTVSFGIETGNARRRGTVLKKGVSDGQIIACAELLRKYGIRFRTLNILGLPGETLAEALETVDLNARLRPDFPWSSLFQPLPGTELAEQCRRDGLLGEDAARQPSFFKDSPLNLRDKREIVNLQKLFYYAVKLPRLRAVLHRAVRLRPNAGFEALFALAHAWIFLRSERITAGEMFRIGFRNIGRYLPRAAGNRQ